MKKILSMMIVAAGVLLMGTSCSSDRDSNPLLDPVNVPASFQLNTPATAQNNVYDLRNGESIVMTASQPNYGLPLTTNYTTEVSLTGEDDSWRSTTSESQAGQITINNKDLNESMAILNGSADDPKYLSDVTTVYLRAKATIAGIDNSGVSTSNTIQITVLPYDPNAGGVATLPDAIYLNGSISICNGWSTFVPMAKAYDPAGLFFRVVYFNAGDEFKVIPGKPAWGTDMGYGQLKSVEDKAESGICSATSEKNSNIKIANAGWYNVCVRAKVKGQDINYELTVRPANVYLIGGATGGWDTKDEWKLTVPATADGEFVSAPATAGGELRIFVDCESSWWGTEFTFYQGNIFYRDVNIISNWAENKGADYSVGVSAGQKVYVNFSAGTGRVE